jgi:hypothetical protein
MSNIKEQILKIFPKAKGVNTDTIPPTPVYSTTVDIVKKKKEECTDEELEIQKIYRNIIIF